MRFLTFILLIVSLTGCNAAPTSTSLPTSLPTSTNLQPTTTSQPTEKLATQPAVPSTHTQEVGLAPSPTATPSCVEISYEEYAQVEILSPQGMRVLVDVYDPGLLSGPASAKDILLTTHTHWDHVNVDFQEAFPGRQLYLRSGIIEMGDVTIQGIPSAHNAGDELMPEGGTNYIYLVDTGGLRIAHFGDIGQDALAPEQLDLLAEVDVAITQLANPYSDMSAENQKAIKLMYQVEPRLIIPTHVDLDSATLAVAEWQGLYTNSARIEVCAPNLADRTQILFLGQSAALFSERLSLLEMNW